MTVYGNEDEIERAELYKLFAALFMEEPQDELIRQVIDIFQLESEDTGEDIALDFTRIFLGPGKHLPPYESVHNYPPGDSPRLWGAATDDVQEFYQSVGLAMDEEVNLIPDHISVELLFMAWLIENALSEQQEEFLEEHLVKWIPAYCDEVQGQAQTGFYRDVAELLKELILTDYGESD